MSSRFSLRARRLRRGTRIATIAGLAALLAACGGGQQHGGFGGFPPAPVTLMEVKTATVPIRFEYVGQTAGSKEAEVRARVQGVLEKRSYQEGGAVKAGQTLFVIDPKPYAAQMEQAAAALVQAQAQYAQAKRNFERLQPLLADSAISRREFDDALSAEETGAAAVAQAQARLTEARLNLSYTTVTAPVSGFASRALKSEGSLVSPGQDSLLTTVSQIDPIYVNFSVAESERLRMSTLIAAGKLIAPDAKKGYEVSVRLADASVYPRKGRLAFIDSRINLATGSFDARAQFANADAGLHPGQFVRVIVEGATRPNAILVPQRAVMEGPQGKFVYLAGKSQDGSKDVALPRPVEVGDWVEFEGANQWIIEAGLKPGDKVVIEGMGKIFPVPGGAPIALAPPPAMEAGKGEAKKADKK